MSKIAVVGAGIVGLSTAVRLQEILGSSARISLIADKFGPDTTSDGAAGLFRPSLENIPGVSAELMRKWASASWKKYDSLAKKEGAGVSYISGYVMYDEGATFRMEPNITKELVCNYRTMSDEEHAMFGGKRKKCGVFFTSVLIEPRWHMKWLMKVFLDNGGTIIQKTVKDLKEFIGLFDVVINCSGLGAQKLVNDSEICAYRGQLLKVRAPWLKHFFLTVDKRGYTHAIPGREWVVVGGVHQPGNESTTITIADKVDIWNRATEILPTLKNCEIIQQWVGLRPYRYKLRLEADVIQQGHKYLNVVHNYGHGGTGVGLAWGTACHAADIAQNLLLKSKTAKL